MSQTHKVLLVTKAGKSTRSSWKQQRQRHPQPPLLGPFDGQKRRRSRRRQSANEIDVIRQYLGDCQHHGTGNPLAARSPTMPDNYAVIKLAEIIESGYVGQPFPSRGEYSMSVSSTASSDSLKAVKLKTERGKLGSFWTSRLRLAGAYGFTGLILPPDTNSSKPFPIDQVLWFLLQTEEERQVLKSLVSKEMWEKVEKRVVTTAQLAKQLSSSSPGQN